MSGLASRLGFRARKLVPGSVPGTAALLAIGFVAPSGCGEAGLAADAPMDHARSSDLALAEAVLGALEREDRAGLATLLVTREEHRELLWPELPERTYFSFARARELNERNTRKAVRRVLERYGGRTLELVGLDYTRKTEVYEGFTLHRGARMQVRDVATGEVAAIDVLDVLVEMEGGWKLFNVRE